MAAVNVSTNYKSVLPFGKPHTQLITQPVSFLRSYLSRLESAPFPLLPDRKISDKMERKGELNNGN